ncbi:hypothetical protein D3C80_2051110 [compost metagenome]
MTIRIPRITEISPDPVNDAKTVIIPAIVIPIYGIRFKSPVINPSRMKYFMPIIHKPKLVSTETTIISIIKLTI